MKKTSAKIMVAATLAAFALTSCGSTRVEDKREKVAQASADEIDKVVVVD